MFGNTAPTTLVVHTGGLGDLVLAARLVEGLKTGLGGKIVLLLRKPFLEVPKLFPNPPDQILALDFEPHRQSFPTDDLRQQLHQLLATLRDLKKMSRTGQGSPFDLALFHLGQGDTAHALDALENAFIANAQSLVFLKEDAIYDPIRNAWIIPPQNRRMHEGLTYHPRGLFNTYGRS